MNEPVSKTFLERNKKIGVNLIMTTAKTACKLSATACLSEMKRPSVCNNKTEELSIEGDVLIHWGKHRLQSPKGKQENTQQLH